MTTILDDTFAGAASTDLNAHASDTPGTIVWARNGGFSTASEVLSGSNTAHLGTGTVAVYYANVTPASANYTVQATLTYLGTDANALVGPAARMDSTLKQWYWAFYAVASGLITLQYHLNAGVGVTLGTYALSLAVGDTLQLTLSCNSNIIQVSAVKNGTAVNGGSPVINVSDSNVSAAGHPGLLSQATSGAETNSSGLHFSRITATDIVNPDIITLTSPVAYQVIQRNVATNRGNIAISGTLTSTVPHNIQASFNGGSWQTIATSVAAGASVAWSGTLMGQAAGAGTLSVRISDETSITASVSNVGVTDNILFFGQSNQSGRGTNNQTFTASGSNFAGLFGNDYTWKLLADPYDSNSGQVDTVSSDASAAGSYVPLLASTIVSNIGLPIGIIPCALGGTTISQWQPSGSDDQLRTSLYGSMVHRVLVAGGCRIAILLQGESDCQAGTTQSAWRSGVQSLAAAIKADLGVPVVVCTLPTMGTSVASTAEQQAIRNAQLDAQATDPNVIAGGDLVGINVGTDDSVSHIHMKSDSALAAAAAAIWSALSANVYSRIAPPPRASRQIMRSRS